MLGKKVKKIIFLLILSFIILVSIIFIILKSLEKNVVYFLSPSEIYKDENVSLNKKMRVGGLVKVNSVTKNQTNIIFVITFILTT